MGDAPLRRALARVRPSNRAPHPEELPGSATGGYDRTHDGLISGWFICRTCGTPPTPTPDLLIDGQVIESTRGSTPRGDVPGGLGFLHRFNPTGTPSALIRVQCPTHAYHCLGLDIPAGTWNTPALATIENSTWPIITGWLALLTAPDGTARLVIDGYDPIPVRTNVRRPDAQAYLGVRGVGGFHVDLGAMIGYALPDTTRIRLVVGKQLLAEAGITDSPLGEDTAGCLPSPGDSPLDADEIRFLRHRLRATEVGPCSEDWRDILDRLGQREFTAETEQWAEYFTLNGQSPQQVASWLALRATQALGVTSLNPLPNTLDQSLAIDDERLPARVRTWTEPIIGIHDRPTRADGQTDDRLGKAPSPEQRSEMKVVVAGLVHHKSGLGQNGQNSLKALGLAGIHACPAPFFPALGGWNPRLGPSREAIESMEDHTVLLHLPIDQVIPSLAAQPALLRTDRLIGYFMWELETVPKQFYRALDLVDEIWTGTEFVAEAFRNATETPVHVTGHAVDVSRIEVVTRAELGIPEDAFVVHYSFDANSTVARKNPNAALEAFHLAFGDDPCAVFVLKVRNFQQVEFLAREGDIHARGLLSGLGRLTNGVVITDEWAYQRCLGLIAMADCYLSLHRSEGYGYTIAESLALGTPVIATGYSGNTGLGGRQTQSLARTNLREVLPGEYFYCEAGGRWGDPSVDHAAELLLELRLRIELPGENLRTVETREIGSLDALAGSYTKRLNAGGLDAN
jgi:glycosyltransferase involved in cell wall biosynthesis